MRTSTMPDNFKRYAKTIGSKMTVVELADSFQVTGMTIRNWAKRCGLEILKRPRSNAVDKERIRGLLDSGKRNVDIVRLVKCSNAVVKQVKRKMKKEKEEAQKS